ncbi:hypothetical protein KBD59_05685 [Candidatus Gracilibacteria bacterium]|nr:hypothetical protein [Candidatus Gracilibacteria bacterium]
MLERISDRQLTDEVVGASPGPRGRDLYLELRLAADPVGGRIVEENGVLHQSHEAKIARLVELGLAQFVEGKLIATDVGQRIFAQLQN